MAFVTVEDMYGSIECVCFPKVYDKIRPFLENDRVVSVTGKLSIDADKAPAIIVDKMTEFTIEQSGAATQQSGAATQQTAVATPPVKTEEEKTDAEKKLWLNVTGMDEADMEELMETLTFYEGATPVYFVKDGKKMLCTQKVTPGRGLMAELSAFLPDACIKLL